MGRNPFGIGVEPSKSELFRQNLFYFMREFKHYPFDETFEVFDKKGNLVYTIKKKGVSLVFFNSMMTEMENHYKREKAEMERASRRR